MAIIQHLHTTMIDLTSRIRAEQFKVCACSKSVHHPLAPGSELISHTHSLTVRVLAASGVVCSAGVGQDGGLSLQCGGQAATHLHWQVHRRHGETEGLCEWMDKTDF